MKTSREHTIGWIGSAVFHAILFLVLFLTSLPEILQRPEFVEMSWGSAVGVVQAAPASSAPRGVSSDLAPSKSTTVSRATQNVVPPERRLPDFSGEVLRVPRTEKLTTTETGLGEQKPMKSEVAGDREAGKVRGIGETDVRQPGEGLGSVPGVAAPSAGAGSGPTGIDQGVSFNLRWVDGGIRKKISGELPHYPQGVNIEAQIKVLAVVFPDGSVKGVQPAQKGNSRLEETAMREVRYWRFEPLKPAQPQVDQACEIVFLFTLR